MALSPHMAERLHGPLGELVDGPIPLHAVRPRPKPKGLPWADTDQPLRKSSNQRPADPRPTYGPPRPRRQRYQPAGLPADDLGPRWGTEAYTDMVAGMVLKLTRACRDATLGIGPDHDLVRARVAVLPDRLNDDGTVTKATDIEGTS